MYKEIIFDVETQYLFHEVPDRKPENLKISVVSVYAREIDDDYQELSGNMVSYWEKDLDAMWQDFQKADRIIGYNTISFDVPVLQPYAYFDLSSLPHFDILDEIRKVIGRRIKLDNAVQNTLGEAKTDVGTNAVAYWRAGDPESLAKLQHYCEADVRLTTQLYDFGLQNGYINYKDDWNSVQKIPIDFRYSQAEVPQEKQVGLF